MTRCNVCYTVISTSLDRHFWKEHRNRYGYEDGSFKGLSVPKTPKAYRMFYEWCLKYEDDLIILDQVKKNLKLITVLDKGGLRGSFWNDKIRMNVFRRNLAVYRLYRTCNLPPNVVASLTVKSLTKIGQIIGQTYRIMCLADEKCIFRFIFEEGYVE